MSDWRKLNFGSLILQSIKALVLDPILVHRTSSSLVPTSAVVFLL